MMKRGHRAFVLCRASCHRVVLKDWDLMSTHERRGLARGVSFTSPHIADVQEKKLKATEAGILVADIM